MTFHILIESERILLRNITIKEATQEYVNWLNDKEVNKFLEAGREEHTLKSLKEYIKEKIELKRDCVFLAIIDKKTKLHIGNVKLEPINWKLKEARMGIMIGNKDFWHKGYGTEATKLTIKLCFENLGLDRIYLTVDMKNIFAYKVYKKCGFTKRAWEMDLKRHNSF